MPELRQAALGFSKRLQGMAHRTDARSQGPEWQNPSAYLAVCAVPIASRRGVLFTPALRPQAGTLPECPGLQCSQGSGGSNREGHNYVPSRQGRQRHRFFEAAVFKLHAPCSRAVQWVHSHLEQAFRLALGSGRTRLHEVNGRSTLDHPTRPSAKNRTIWGILVSPATSAPYWARLDDSSFCRSRRFHASSGLSGVIARWAT